jgi:hypothetical protein
MECFSLRYGTRSRLNDCSRQHRLGIDIADAWIEFTFDGRDTNHFVVAFLQDVARILGDAEGEITCTVSSEGEDLALEFYSVRNHQLLRQLGRIVRDPAITEVRPA